MKKLLFFLSAAIMCHSVQAKDTPPYRDASLPVEQRVNDLMSRMTLEEKIGQLNQRNGEIKMDELENMIKNGQIGSILNAINGEQVDRLQRIAMEKTRLGIPLLIGRDVIHGHRTIFPIPLGQAATFDPSVVQNGARIAATESSSEGVRWVFAPMIDISRDPRWGRIAESLGEDTYLTSELAKAMVKGFQGDDLTDGASTAVCLKHFAGYGAAEGGRDYNSTNIPERQLREVYLAPFKEAIDHGAMSLMVSFNDNDGVPMTANKHLLTDILRNEWKFDGFTLSDYNAINELIDHGMAADRREAALYSISAGTDIDMDTKIYIENLKDLLDNGDITIDMIDRGVAGLLRMKFKLGLFENPYTSTPHDVIYAAAHLDAARETARKSAVLLKNDNKTLPLKSDVKTILLTGPMADAKFDQLGTWSIDGQKERTQTLLDGLRDECKRRNATLLHEPALTYTRDTISQLFDDAVKAAASADAIVVAVGEEAIFSGEAHSLTSLNLIGNQSRLIDAMASTGKPVILVVIAGRPLIIEHEAETSKAVLYSFHPGTMGGPALADLIFGNYSPSGKLPVTVPRSVGQIPFYYNRNSTGRPVNGTEVYLDGIPKESANTFLGCRSYWLDTHYSPLYPFGYGLSYGDFEYSNIKLDKETYSPEDIITAQVTLKNNGEYTAEEVAQLYIRDMSASVVRPIKELKRFTRINLRPDESTIVEFQLPVKELSFIGTDMKPVLEPGEFTLWIGGDSQCSLSKGFSVE